MRVIATFLAAVLVLGSGQICNAQSTVPTFSDTKQRLTRPNLSTLSRLRFLTTTDFFPFNFLDASGRLSGFNVDLARAICAKLEMLDRCQIQALPFDEAKASLENGGGEALIAGLAVTPEEREKFLFSRPYLQFPARFVTRRGARLAEPLYEQIAERRVGVLAGTAHEQMLRDFFPQAQPVTYTREVWLTGDLASGKIDAALGDGVRLAFWLADTEGRTCCVFSGGPYLAPEYLGQGLAIAVSRDQPLLADAMDFALQSIEADGTFRELYLRYFPVGFY